MKILVFGDYHFVGDHVYERERKAFDFSKEFVELKNNYHKDAINALFNAEADLYVSVGDLTNLGTEEELTKIYELIKQTGKEKNFVHVLGNHDLYSMTPKDIEVIKNHKAFHSIDTEKVKLIFMNTARVMDYENYGGYLSEKNRNWLKEELLSAGEKLTIVFAHHPVYDTTFRSNYNMLSIDKELEIEKILNEKKGKGIYVCGHNHYASIKTKGDWTFIQIDSFLDHPKYSLLEIDETKVNVTSHELLDSSYDEVRLLIGNTQAHYEPIFEGTGTTDDREILIKL